MIRKDYVSMMVAGFAAMLVSGAGVLSLSLPTQAASTTITIPNLWGNMSTLDPADWGPQYAIDQGALFEGLFGYSPTSKIVPKLAQKWTSTEGGKVWTFWLRKNAKWSNGAPVTAEDFYYAWMRMLAPSNTSSATWASVEPYIANAIQYHAGAASASAVGIKVLSKYQIQLTLSAPHDILPDLAIAGSMPLYPPDVKRYPATWWMPKNFVGDGPYVLKSFVVNGEMVFVKNSDYVGPAGQINSGNAQQINVIPNPTVPVEDFLSHQLSVAVIGTGSDYKYASAHLTSELRVDSTSNLGTLLWDRSADKSPLFNRDVRQAISMAINRAPMVNPVLNNMVGATEVYGFPGWLMNSLEHGLPYNVKKARQLLDEAGYPGGKGIGTLYLYCPTQSTAPTLVATAEVIAEELKTALNLNFKIEPTNNTLYGNMVYGGVTNGTLPGYVVATSNVNWPGISYYSIHANQQISSGDWGSLGPQSLLAYTARNWYFPAYDPNDVKAWGSPTDTALGVKFSTWQPLINTAKADINYLDAWTARQPEAYQKIMDAPGTLTLTQQLNGYVDAYSKAKTDVSKHAAWEALWKWVGTYSEGAEYAEPGLNSQVYLDKHEPKYYAQWRIWNQEAPYASAAQAKQLVAKLVNGMMVQGYNIPLYYIKTIYLTEPSVSADVNPYAFGGFYLQYFNVK